MAGAAGVAVVGLVLLVTLGTGAALSAGCSGGADQPDIRKGLARAAETADRGLAAAARWAIGRPPAPRRRATS